MYAHYLYGEKGNHSEHAEVLTWELYGSLHSSDCQLMPF